MLVICAKTYHSLHEASLDCHENNKMNKLSMQLCIITTQGPGVNARSMKQTVHLVTSLASPPTLQSPHHQFEYTG